MFGAALQALAYALLIPGFAFAAFPVFYSISGFGQSPSTFAQTPPRKLRAHEGSICWNRNGDSGQYGQRLRRVAPERRSKTRIPARVLRTVSRHPSEVNVSMADIRLSSRGAALCPLAATAFASHFPRHFTKFWTISLAIALLNVAVLLYAFKFNYVIDTDESGEVPRPPSPREEVALEAQTPPLGGDSSSVKSLAAASAPPATYPPEIRTEGMRKVRAPKEPSVLRQALLNRTTILASIFILFYVGSEVSMGGWIVTFLIDNRGGGTSAGYVATGFWLGLTVGRAILNPLNRLVGEKRIVYVYLLLALALEVSRSSRALFFSASFSSSLFPQCRHSSPSGSPTASSGTPSSCRSSASSSVPCTRS